MEAEEKTRKKQLMILAAIIVFCVWFLLLVKINSVHAAGFCKVIENEWDRYDIYSHGTDFRYCVGLDCLASEVSSLEQQGYSAHAVYSSFIELDNIRLVVMYKAGAGYVSIVTDYGSPPEWIKDGCSSEGAMTEKLFSMILYVLSGMVFVWAFIKGISIINS